jgi:acetyl-CoA C-acetyltransferase
MTKVQGIKLKNKGKIYLYEDIFMLKALRTPFGRFQGSYSNISATDLGVFVTRSLIESSGLNSKDIDQLIFASTIPSSTDSIFLPRHIALKSGLEVETPASMVQRICASGMESIIIAANDIAIGCSDTIIAGGTENMTRAPLASFEIRNGFHLGAKPFSDLLWEGLNDTYCSSTMGQTAENLAEKYSITREDADLFAFESHSRAIKARNEGVYNDQICNFTIIKEDETIRKNVSMEKLSNLKPVFSKNGVQTAGNSSLIADGAAAVIVTSTNKGINPAGKIVAASITAGSPDIMGITPVSTIKNLLQVTGLNISDISLWEINEAFAAQYIAVEKQLQLDRSKVNVNGGSIAIGHPLAATGIRIVSTLLYELKKRNLKYGIASACVGGGQGTAILVESL